MLDINEYFASSGTRRAMGIDQLANEDITMTMLNFDYSKDKTQQKSSHLISKSRIIGYSASPFFVKRS